MTADRMPPVNLEAERSVIGCAMLDPAAADEVIPILDAGDFYRDEHTLAWEGVRALRESGVPCDAVALGDWLERRGAAGLGKGGTGNRLNDLLAELVGAVPHAANATYYAGIVRERAVARRLIEACEETLKACYAGLHTSPELVAKAESAVFALGEREASGTTRDMDAVVGLAMGVIQDRQEGAPAGVMTGFPDLDDVLCGLRPGTLAILAARPSIGKAQPLDAKVLTPFEFREMGSLQVGDYVTGSDGFPTRVVGVFPQGEMPVYRVTMTDGSSTECTEDHLWFTQDRNERRRGCDGSVKTLGDIMRTLERDGGGANHRIPVAEPAEFVLRGVPPLDPYLLGLLLGDGSFRGTCIRFDNPEPDIAERLVRLLPDGDTATAYLGPRCPSYRISKGRHDSSKATATRDAIESLGLRGLYSQEKFIPWQYLYGTVVSRLRLLRGLLDTDGHVCGSGMIVEYTTVSPRLAADVAFLVRSLGGIARTAVKVTSYSYGGETKRGADAHRIHISFPCGTTPVSSVKHLARWKPRTRDHGRLIASVEPSGSKECQCIKVEAEDSLYVTDDFIVTHNTALGLAIASNAATAKGQPALFVSLEMDAEEIGERLLSAWSDVGGRALKQPRDRLGEGEWSRLIGAAGRLSGLPLKVDDAPARTVGQIAANARRIRRRRGLSMVVVDYLGLIDGERQRGESRQEEVARISRRLKAMAKELGVPVLALHQLNRQPESRDDRRPRLSDLRESGAIEQDAHVVMLLHRPEFYDPTDRPGMAEVIVAKNRSGAAGIGIEMAFRKEFTRFESVAAGGAF